MSSVGGDDGLAPTVAATGMRKVIAATTGASLAMSNTSVRRTKLGIERPGADPFWQGRHRGTDRVSGTVGGTRRGFQPYAEIQNNLYALPR